MVTDARGSGAPLKHLSPSQFSRISQLLDESIEMAPAERDAWLREIERSDPTAAALLRWFARLTGLTTRRDFPGNAGLPGCAPGFERRR